MSTVAPPVAFVDVPRRLLRREPDAMPRDARPSRSRRERLPEIWRTVSQAPAGRRARTA
ncbi:MAG TPA: hypothetical protein VNR36_06385 [Pseudolysinimonas sp.]|nr:hypothetical protein [Pseudolysinimonas sp.]